MITLRPHRCRAVKVPLARSTMGMHTEDHGPLDSIAAGHSVITMDVVDPADQSSGHHFQSQYLGDESHG